jgi:transporter family protein
MRVVLEPDTPSGCETNRGANVQTVTSHTSVSYPQWRIAISESKVIEQQPSALAGVAQAIRQTLNSGWFWYSIASAVCWTAWAFTARLGSQEIPPVTMQFVSAFGFLLVALVLFVTRKIQINKNLRANGSALLSGVLLALGGIALFGAYRYGENASVVTAATSLYPFVTAIFAVMFLREKPNKLQLVGLCFAAVAIVLLSL